MRDARILADSIGPHGIRLTTFEVTLERPFLAEFNTHRMVSRNSASSRAIPTEQLIERARRAPYVPVFAARVRGMGVGMTLDSQQQAEAARAWLSSRDAACIAAEALLHTDKSRANRLLEPFLYQTIIASATDWLNFFNLRDHEGAQPEFRHVAQLMKEALAYSQPQALGWGEWHLPLWDGQRVLSVSEADKPQPAQVSAGRCARVSYDKHHADDAPANSARRWQDLSEAGHWSPGEHPARTPTQDEWDEVQVAQDEVLALIQYGRIKGSTATRLMRGMEYWGNFHGYIQLRKHYGGEAVFSG